MTRWLAGLAVAFVLLLVDGRTRARQRLGAPGKSPGLSRLHQMAVVAAVIAVVQVSPAISALAIAAAMTSTVVRRRISRARSESRRRRAAVDVTYALAAELRSGQPPGQALAAVARAGGVLAEQLSTAAGAVAGGASIADELRRIADSGECERMRPLAAVWAATERSGGHVALVLDQIAESFDAEDDASLELDAALAGPRATMVMLSALPLVGVLLGESIGTHPLSFLLHRPAGHALVVGAAVLDLAGVAWTRRLTRGAVAA